MKKTHIMAHIFLCISGIMVNAVPPNTARLDGRPTEYDNTELRGSFSGAPGWGAGNVISNLYVTWDADYLYVALQGWEADNKLSLQIDVDPMAETGATTTTNWPGTGVGYMEYNGLGWRASTAETAQVFGLDYMVASEGFYNNVLRIGYDGEAVDTNAVEALFDNGNGVTPLGTPVDMVVLADETDCVLKGFEARIPWSVLYEGTRFGTIEAGETVPRGATLRMFANLHNNEPNAYSSPDTIPAQGVESSYDNGLLITDTYIDVVIDSDNDGIPDMDVGDVNAPFILMAAGRAASTSLWVMLNEPLDTTTAEDTANWSVDGSVPLSADLVDERSLLLSLGTALNTTGGLSHVTASNVQDLNGNSKTASFCFFPSSTGLETPTTVRFVLETASGFGVSIGASDFFINGSAAPLEYGYPPSQLNPLQPLAGSLYYRDVVFPAGTPGDITYKFSGVLNNTGTNNYEAIRLDNFQNASRPLSLPSDGSMLVVTDYLGAAAAPYRNPDVAAEGYNLVYSDAGRGDAGVRQRTTVTFQLDLSAREPSAIQRVLIQGTDPLRGFNVDNTGIIDWAGSPGVGWDIGGLELLDDGTNGDTTAGDGIYSRTWVFSDNGKDAATVPNLPNSLVGGDLSTQPYAGVGWANRRSPRSFKYKYYVLDAGENPIEYPGADIEAYLPDDENDIVFDPLVWGNNDIPFLSVSNAPNIIALDVEGGQATLAFTNIIGAMVHGAEVSSDLTGPWSDYGFTPQSGGEPGLWTLTMNSGVGAAFYRVYAGDTPSGHHVYWKPNPVPATGATLRVWYNQIGRALAGRNDVNWFGANPWSDGAPFVQEQMTFDEDGRWYVDLPVAGQANGFLQFLFTDSAPTIYDKNGGVSGNDYQAQIGGRATWSPDPVAPGGTLTVTYDTAGGLLDGAANVNIHVGFDGWEGGSWQDVQGLPMTSAGGTLWTVDVPVPANRTMTANFVFNNGTTWDNNSGRNWAAFIVE